jgi:hypothetical protein
MWLAILCAVPLVSKMLKNREANPLAVFGLRELDHCPPHFTPVDFGLRTTDKNIRDWVWSNLSGRFWYGDWYATDSNSGKVNFGKRVAFELAGEASMFALMLDQINKYEDS